MGLKLKKSNSLNKNQEKKFERWLRNDKVEIDRLLESLIRPRMYEDHQAAWELAFKLRPKDDLIRRMFKSFDLDQSNPFHWRAMIEIMFATFLSEDGRPVKWTPREFARLYNDVREIRGSVENGETLPDTKVVALLRSKKGFKERYSDYKPETLRERVGELSQRMPEIGTYLWEEFCEEYRKDRIWGKR